MSVLEYDRANSNELAMVYSIFKQAYRYKFVRSERFVNVKLENANSGRVITITLRYVTLVTTTIMPLPQNNKEYGTKEYW